MFAVAAFFLLSAIRRDPLAVSFAALPDLCQSRIPFACFGLSFRQTSGEQKSAKPRESGKSRKMNTYKIAQLRSSE